MKFTIIAVGTKMPSWVQEGYAEYAKRLPKELSPKLIELAIGPRGKGRSIEQAKEHEAQLILHAIPKGVCVVALDVKGKRLKTEDIANKLASWQMNGDDICLLIGGPDGFTPELLAKSQERWSLSDLTLPHPLVRVVLIEQLYRAWTILQHHPYHK